MACAVRLAYGPSWPQRITRLVMKQVLATAACLLHCHPSQRLRQRAVGIGEAFQYREMVGAVDRQQLASQAAPDPRLGVIDRLPAQLGQLGAAVGDEEPPRLPRQMQYGAVAARLRGVEPELDVQVVEPDRLEIVEAGNRQPSLDRGQAQDGCGQMAAGGMARDVDTRRIGAVVAEMSAE